MKTDPVTDADADRLAERALEGLRRPLARLDPAPGGYKLRLGRDRRTRVLLTLDEPAFRRLAQRAPLTPDDGGWVLGRTHVDAAVTGGEGRPGALEGEREILDPHSGVRMRRRANLGESPIAWLARRRDARGRPWLGPLELLAADRLRADWERAGVLGRLTMDWSGMPRSGAGWTGVDPAERDRTAKERLARALDALDPTLRALVEQVVLAARPLETAERTLHLPRRSGKVMLKLALGQLVTHYGLG